MPRELPTVTITIDGEDIVLTPIRGAKNATVVMELVSLASQIIYAASKANINLSQLITEDGFNFSAIQPENFLAFGFVADELNSRWERLLVKVFPVMLCKDMKWLAEHGTPFEYFAALGAALTLNAPHIFGEKLWASLKNFLSAPAETEAQEEAEETS